MHSVGYLFAEGIKSLWKNRSMSIASIGVLISCLLLTGVAGLLSLNMSSVMKSIEGSNQITVYLQDDVPQLTSIEIGEQIRKLDNIESCTFVSKDEGLAQVMETLDEDGDILEGFTGDNNFLPDAYEISLVDLSRYDETIAQITAIEGVGSTTNYRDIAQKLSNLDMLVRYAGIGIVIILSIVSLFIISNTVKVTMFSRRMEISIMKSVGATNWFVRMPFIVEGLFIGILSGILSASVIYFAYDKVMQSVINIVPFFDFIDIQPFAFLMFIVYIVVGSVFGLMGGGISISKYLKREGENAVV